MRKAFVLFVSLCVGLLFGYAAITKLTDYENFRFGLSESPFISPFSSMLAWIVPVTELVIVVFLLLSYTRLAGLYAASIVMFLFTFYIAAMLLFAVDIPCSCGGVLESMSWPVHLVFNAVFTLLSVTGVIMEHKRKRMKNSANLTNLTYAKRYSASPDTD